MDTSEAQQSRNGRGEPQIANRIADLLGDARAAREMGDWRKLRLLVNAVLALDPDNAEAEALLAGSARRRQMTLMFCDIVNSTKIADERDPEEMSAILRDYRRTCARVIEKFGGFVDDNQGDGMLVRFGYPEIHEDDAHRAVCCGLEMIAAVRDRPVDLHIRIGVHTDLVVLDGVGVAGATTNEAARIQNLARPDTVVVSDTTQALVNGWFDVESMGQIELRGVSRQVEVFTVLGERTTRHGRAGVALSPFVGRQAELEQVTAHWRAARRHHERVAGGGDTLGGGSVALFITGAAGLGKTRLVTEVASAVDAPLIQCRCSSYHETTSLHAFRPLLEQACQITEADGPNERLAKLRARLGEDADPSADLPFLAAALQIPPAAISAPSDMDPRMLREIALRTAARLVRSHVPAGPSILFVDDLHWADQSTLDLISTLLAAPQPGLLVVLAARVGFEPPWPEQMLHRLHLDPLTGPELEEMARLMPEGSRLPVDRRAELISRSDGIPLFLEELVRTADALDKGRQLYRSIRYSDYRIPAALRDPLLARLASPGVDLDLAQIAATIGRDVDQDLLQRVAGLAEDEIRARLGTLVAAGLVDTYGGNLIRFRHELIREVAYETQRHASRRERHSRIADNLLHNTTGSAQGDAGEAAFHLEKAQRYGEAIEAHLRAARRDQGVGAHTEATRRLTLALNLLTHLPPGRSRQRTELTARELRSFSAVIAGGYAAPEAAEDHPRCVELCESLGLAPELLPGLIRSWSYYAFRGHLTEADQLCDTMQRVVDGAGLSFPAREMTGGVIAFFRGRFNEARQLMRACVEHPWLRTPGRPPTDWPLPNDPLVAVLAHLVPTLWIGGQRDEADAVADRALRRARELSFPYGPFSVGYVNSLLAVTRRLQGDHDDAGRLATEMIELSERHGFVLWGLAGVIQSGMTAVHGGDRSALGPLVDNVATWRRLLVADVWTPYWLTELAVVQRFAGRPESALESLDEALAVARETGSHFYSAETLRIRGELRRLLGHEGAQADLAQAIELAARQGAPAFEERAAASLGRAIAR